MYNLYLLLLTILFLATMGMVRDAWRIIKTPKKDKK